MGIWRAGSGPLRPGGGGAVQVGGVWGCWLPERGSSWARGTPVFPTLLQGPRATCLCKTTFPESGARAPPVPLEARHLLLLLVCFRAADSPAGGVLRGKTGARSSWRADETEKVVWTDVHTHGLMASVTAPWSRRGTAHSLAHPFRVRSVVSVATFSIRCSHIPSFTHHLPVDGYFHSRK